MFAVEHYGLLFGGGGARLFTFLLISKSSQDSPNGFTCVRASSLSVSLIDELFVQSPPVGVTQL